MASTALLQAAPSPREPMGCERFCSNLHLATHYLGTRDKRAFVLDYVRDHAGQSGIVYCLTRKDAEALQALLAAVGIHALHYHAGLSDAKRKANKAALAAGEGAVIVTTNGFEHDAAGPNVRYVIHYNMPESLEIYYAEATQAGRDGAPAESVLLWNDTDISTNRFFIERTEGTDALLGKEPETPGAARYRRLRAMAAYCMTADCLQECLAKYFGDEANAERCSCCSNCESDEQPVDVTELAFAVMRCVHEMRGSFGKTVIIDVLRGARGVKLEETGFYGLKNYGAAKAPAVQLRVLIELMIARGYLTATEGTDPRIGYGPRWQRMTEPGFALHMKKVERPPRVALT